MCRVIVFPFKSRTGRIRDVASKWRMKRGRARTAYKQQVRDGLLARWSAIGLPPHRFEAEWLDFWRAVESLSQGGPNARRA